VDNARILESLRRVASAARERLCLRLPLVPGMTDDDENLHGVASLALELGLAAIELCPYHSLGRSKHAELGRALPPAPPLPDRARIERAAALLAARGLAITLA